MGLGDFTLVEKRVLPVFLLVDTSNSMSKDDKMIAVNRAIPTMLNVLKHEMENARDQLVTYQISIISFGNGKAIPWQPNGPVPIQEIDFKPLEARGNTPFLKGLRELQKQLDSLNKRDYAPSVILLSDGTPWVNKDDTHYYEKCLDEIKKFKQDKRGGRCQFLAVNLGSLTEQQKRFLLSVINQKRENLIDASKVNTIKDAFEFVTLSVTQRVNTYRVEDADEGIEDSDETETIRCR